MRIFIHNNMFDCVSVSVACCGEQLVEDVDAINEQTASTLNASEYKDKNLGF